MPDLGQICEIMLFSEWFLDGQGKILQKNTGRVLGLMGVMSKQFI